MEEEDGQRDVMKRGGDNIDENNSTSACEYGVNENKGEGRMMKLVGKCQGL